jgi:alpha-glucoside transport system substrate-binding protein
MRSPRRGLAFAGLAAVMAMVAAACGGGGGGGEGGGGGPDLSGQKVNVVAVWTGTEQKRITEVLQKFNDDTGADASFTSAGSADLVTFIGTKIQGGKPPDIAILPNPGLLRDFAENGDLQPLDDIVGDVVDSDYASVWRDVATVDGKLYGVYYKAAQKSTFWYNVNVFNDAGVQPPEDWPGLLQTAQTVDQSGVTPYAIGGADAWVLTDWFENVYLRTAGPEKYDQLAAHEIPWTDSSVKEALDTLGQIFGKGDLIEGGPSGALQQTFEDSVATVFSDPPKAGMVYEGDFVGGIVGDSGAQLGTDANFFDFPSINGSPPSVMAGGDVAVLLTDNPAAKELIKFLASPEAAEVWIPHGGFISPNTSVDLSVYPDDISRRAAQALAQAGENVRYDMSDLQPAEFGGTTGQGMFKGFQDFLKDPSQEAAIMKELESSAQQAFG